MYTLVNYPNFLSQDIERNDGSPEKPYFMSKDLLRILDYTNKEQQQKEAED